MSIEFKLPTLGENVDAGDVTRVLVKVGDTIKVDQNVLEMETGKATVEIPSSVAGVIKEILVKEGSKARVGQVILTVDGTRAQAAPAPASAPAKPAAPAAPPSPKPAPQPAAAPRPATVPVAAPPPPAPVVGHQAVPASPATRLFAREVGVNIQEVSGSGPGGRVSIEDVKTHARGIHAGASSGGRPAQPALPDFSKWGPVEREALNNVRIATAEHMALSWSTIPHVTLHDKADLTELERLRQSMKSKAEAAGAKLTVTAFLVKIAASALKVHGKFNAALDLARQETVYRKYCHVGVAVDTDRGLVVPVVRDADRKNIIQIAVEIGKLADKAKARKLSPDEMSGGCFTITNLGSIGCGFFTPIVNFPEVGILGVGRAVTEPVSVGGFFQPRLLMPLSLSFDHRLIDGADGARFLRWVIDAIQQPVLLSLEG